MKRSQRDHPTLTFMISKGDYLTSEIIVHYFYWCLRQPRTFVTSTLSTFEEGSGQFIMKGNKMKRTRCFCIKIFVLALLSCIFESFNLLKRLASKGSDDGQ